MMKGQQSWCRRQDSDRSWFIYGLFSLILILLTACDSPLLPKDWRAQQPASPLIPGTNTLLAQNRWQVVEITQEGEPVAIDAIQPLYVTFTVDGYLHVRAPVCFEDAYVIGAASASRYRLRSTLATGVGCGEPRDTQRVAMSKALLKTKEYELKDQQLFLTSDDVRIVLEIANP